MPQAILGTSLPILLGQHRITWKLLWYGAFTSAVAQQQQGGSGLAKQGVEYVYTASVIGAVCMGNCVNFLAVWDSNGRYAVQYSSESTILPSSGSIQYIPQNQGIFKLDLGVSLVSSYSQSANDYGSPGSVTLSGTQNTPLQYTTSPTPGPGQYTISYNPTLPPGVGAGGAASFAISSVANASGGNTVYTGVITGGASNAYAGYTFSFKKSNFPQNNGVFTCVASTTSTLTVSNAKGIADTAVMQALIISGAPIYIFNTAQASAEVIVNYVAYRYQIQEVENDIAAATVTVQYQATFAYDIGVNYYPSGVALSPVSGSPSVGQYNPNGGNYEFNSTDWGLGVTISYAWNNQNTDSNAPNIINLTFFSGLLGQAAWSYLSSSFPSGTLAYSEVAYVASSGLYLGYSPLLPSYNFEIAGPYAFGNGIPDANPADLIYQLLTNPSYKLNYPVFNIGSSLQGTYTVTGSVTSGTFTSGEVVKQSTTGAVALLIGTVTGSNSMSVQSLSGPADGTHTWVGQTSSAVYTPSSLPTSSCVRAMWSANNFFISDILDSQQSLMNTISKWCEAGQAYLTYDEGILKFIPLVDTSCIGNGASYSPPTQPIISLDDDDFVTEPGKDPIIIQQTPWQNRWNRVQVRWSVRTNNYNEDIYQVDDVASVQQFKLMTESSQDYQFITTLNAAQFAGNMRLQRYSAIFTTIKFVLKSNLAFLSPGDIIVITDGLINTSGTMFGNTPVRITKMVDDPEKGIEIEAENFPWSVGAALLYNAQAQLPSNTGDGPQEYPGNTTPVVFNVPNAAASWQGSKLYVFINGASSNWGGCQVYISYNGVDYNFYGQYDTPGRIGSTTADFPLPSGWSAGSTLPYEDTSDTLSVDMSVSGATLQSVTSADLAQLVTLSAIISGGLTFNTQKLAANGQAIGVATSTGGGSQGPLSPSSAYLPTGYVADVWTNINGIIGTGNGFASSIVSSSVGGTNPIVGYIEFTIPAGAGAITGFTVSFNAYVSGIVGGSASFLIYTSCYYNGAGTSPANSSVSVSATSSTAYTIGPNFGLGSSTNWNTNTLSATELNSSTFGIKIFALLSGTATSATLNIQNIQATVTWSGGVSASTWTNPQNVNSSVSYASSALVAPTGGTLVLQAYSFGFNVPFGFLFSGIQVNFNAYTSSHAASVTAGIYYKNVQIGSLNGNTISSSVTGYVLGGNVDTWGIQNVANVDLFNSQGISGFSVGFQVTGTIGDTVYINDVQITLFGTSDSNLELIAYENASLSGQNSYNLTTIMRGCLGSYPCDHPAGSTFARLDQATFVYDVPSNYLGSSLYFKFLSFNAYGNQLQQLSEVSPYIIPITSNSPGAIDPITGALRTGTPNWTVPQIEAATAAVHGNFGIQNIPRGYVFSGPQNQASGLGQWVPYITGGGGAGSAVNLYVLVENSNYLANAWDYVLANTTSGSFTITLPKASNNPNTVIGFKKTSSDANAVVTNCASGSDTVEFASSVSVKTYLESLFFTSDGISNWDISSAYNALPAGQLGDTLRYNINGDNSWDAVNAASSEVGMYLLWGNALYGWGAFNNSGTNQWYTSGSTDNLPTGALGASRTLTGSASASTSTVIGMQTGQNGNNTIFPIVGFYRYSMRLAIGATSNARYWLGLGVYANGSSNGTNGTPITSSGAGTTKYASDTPNSTTVGFRFSAGTDSHWQAVSITAGVGQTTVDTGVSPNTNPHLFEMTTNLAGTTINYFIDGVLVATISTNVPPPASGDPLAAIFWTGDNKNTATSITGTYYEAYMSLK